ncbi:MAG: phospho-N-acetylmuramoyl-pentapeptide-transferase [Myxococcales bacterium]|nr:phospho-N-acetylmuramoyl-pentapeptide-transferase [Myxococcales bacterium]
MIYYLLYPLTEDFTFLNVLRYVPFRVLCATLTAMFLTFGLYPWFIRRLQKKQVGQVVRKEGPASHFSKAGTPTMGGALMLLALVLSTVLWADPSNAMVWVVTAITATYGVVGYIDDAAKVRRKSTGGLAGRYKLLFQFTVAIALCAWLFYGEEGLPADWLAIRDRLALPFVKFLPNEKLAALGQDPLTLPKWLYVIFASFVIVGFSNAVNLTDGLDGLAMGPVMVSAGTYAILAYLGGAMLFNTSVAEYLFIPYLDSASELAIYCASVVGVGFGFLWFNTYPATVFMGDVGSLALGGGLGALAVVTKNEITSLLLGGIFVVEALSVIIQVGVFKATKGKKRVFLMAPIHHHFEKKGWPEPKVIVRFWIISIMLAVATLATLKLR